MANAAQQMPEHVGTAYKDAVDNIIFLKRQQWLATNYALLVYAAIFVISAHYFSRTDLARNWLGVLTIATFIIGDAPDFVEVGEEGIAVDDAMRRQRRVQLVG